MNKIVLISCTFILLISCKNREIEKVAKQKVLVECKYFSCQTTLPHSLNLFNPLSVKEEIVVLVDTIKKLKLNIEKHYYNQQLYLCVNPFDSTKNLSEAKEYVENNNLGREVEEKYKTKFDVVSIVSNSIVQKKIFEVTETYDQKKLFSSYKYFIVNEVHYFPDCFLVANLYCTGNVLSYKELIKIYENDDLCQDTKMNCQ